MFFRVILLCCLAVLGSCRTFNAELEKRDVEMDCSDAPIELAIVLDSSSSIWAPDFDKAKLFLRKLVSNFKIGPQDTRVSLILFARGVYPDQALALDSTSNAAELDAALAAIKHVEGDYTDTGPGIDYMREHLLALDKVRPGFPRIAVVITDGDSQEEKNTTRAAIDAANDGIEMVAVGVGRVDQEELLRIAVGNQSHVIKAANFDKLESVLAPLRKQLCVPFLRPTTPAPTKVLKPATPPPKTTCELSAADLYFVFSQKSLGLELTSETVNFINTFIAAHDFERAFRYGVISDTCDAGFDIGYYNSIDAITKRLHGYEQYTLPSLVGKLVTKAYPSTCSGSVNGKVAVIFSGDGQKTVSGIQKQVNTLVKQGVQVFVVDLQGYGVKIDNAKVVSDASPVLMAHQLIQLLCA